MFDRVFTGYPLGMAQMQHIVVGLDEGDLADSAVVTALHVSRLLGVPLNVVHAVQSRAEHPWFADEQTLGQLQIELIVEAQKDRHDHLWKLLQPFAVTPQELENMLFVSAGRPSNVLAEHAADLEGAAIVLGGHRHRGFLDFGGTTRQLLGHTYCPMWVQDARPWTEIRNILVPVDLSPGSALVLAMAKQLAIASGARITLLHCFESLANSYGADVRLEHLIESLRARERAEFDQFVSKHKSDDPLIEARFEDGDPAKIALSMQDDYDLIVMGTHGHSGIGRLLLGSHAYHTLHQAKTPVVVVPQPPAAT